MNKTFIITNIAPALMLFLAAMVVQFFPPSKKANTLLLKVPDWWSRDDKTWKSAYQFLAKKYLIYSVFLAIICVALFYQAPVYGATIGYLFLLLFFILAQIQVRRYMHTKVK